MSGRSQTYFPQTLENLKKKRMIKVGGMKKKLKIIERVNGKRGYPKGHNFNFDQ